MLRSAPGTSNAVAAAGARAAIGPSEFEVGTDDPSNGKGERMRRGTDQAVTAECEEP